MIGYTKYPTDGRVRSEAESLVEWGYEVFCLTPREGAVPRMYSLKGVTVKELDIQKYVEGSQFRYVLSYLAFLAHAFVACTRLFFKSQLNIIHVHNMPDILVFAGLLPRLFGCTLILDVHDSIPETYVAKFGTTSRFFLALLRLEERVCCSLAQRIICVNHIQRDALVGRGIPAEKIAVVVTVPKFLNPAPVNDNHHERGQVFRMVNHGTISSRLGIDLIVRATMKLVDEVPGFELHLYGAGDDLRQVMQLTEDLGLSTHIRFHGTVPWDTLPQELQTMDVGIVANRVNVATELMLPSKLIDYVALGIPAIAPRLKAIQYYFSPDMVCFFEPGNVDSMVAATVQLYRDKQRAEQQAQSAKSFLDKYGWHNHQGSLRNLYDDLGGYR